MTRTSTEAKEAVRSIDECKRALEECVPVFETISLLRLTMVLNGLGIKLRYEDDLDGADGLLNDNEIVLRRGMHPRDEFFVMARELAYQLMMRSQRWRGMPAEVRYDVSQAVGYAVSVSIGLDVGFPDARSETIDACFDEIQTVAQAIVKHIYRNFPVRW